MISHYNNELHGQTICPSYDFRNLILEKDHETKVLDTDSDCCGDGFGELFLFCR
jgi:hypothetical protein